MKRRPHPSRPELSRMRLSGGSFANAAAWAVVGVLIVAAILVTNRLGFVGLFLLVPLHRGFDGLRWAALILHQSPWTRRCRGKREPAWPGPFGW